MTDTLPNDDSQQQILGPRGNPIPSKITWRDRWKSFSKKTRVAIVAITAFIAGLAALLTNLQTIKDQVRPAQTPPNVPPIIVEITNSSKEAIDVVTRGDFFLWLPGHGARHNIGKYELRNVDGSSPDSGGLHS